VVVMVVRKDSARSTRMLGRWRRKALGCSVESRHQVREPAGLFNHGKAAYHLLLQGGDQVYADPMWDIDGPMKEWLW
jgi:hypothetical protein